MNKFQNLHLENRPLFEQYRGLFEEDIEAAHAVLTNSQLENKVFNESEFNDITEYVSALENGYFNNIPITVQNNLEIYNQHINNLIFLGEYTDDQTYYENNVVFYDGETYFCLAETTGNLPTDETYWFKLEIKGEKGAAGLGINLKASWTPNIQYQALDVVLYNNYLWVTNANSLGEEPSESSANWLKLVDYIPRKINLDDTNLQIGDIYFHILD